MKCYACFQGEVVPTAGPGRTLRYKAIQKLAVPEDLLIPTCNHCGEHWVSPGDAKRIDAAMEVAYRKELLAKVRAVLPDPKDADRIERNRPANPIFAALSSCVTLRAGGTPCNPSNS